MNKTIILGKRSNISANANKWLFGIGGTLYIVLGIMKALSSNEIVISVGYVIMGLVIMIYGVIIFSLTPLTPKLKISDSSLEFKHKMLSRAIEIPWTSIQSIEFGSYEIMFHLIDRDEQVFYNANANASVEIKSSIREIAEQKNIQVSGG